MTNELGELIARRDELKINIDSHLRYDRAVDAPGDHLRDELGQVVTRITELLHQPFAIEADRLAEKRAELQQELTTAQHQRAQLRSAHETAQGARVAALSAAEDASAHASSSKALFSELHDLEARIGELELAIHGCDGMFVALVEAEGAQMISGISAS